MTDSDLEHVCEFGVYRGHSLQIIRSLFDASVPVFGFDSFEGLPSDWTRANVKKELFDTGGRMPEISGVIIFKGWFSETIPQYKKIAKPISLLHIDCDLYSSTKDVLSGLNDFIVRNTIIVFDEWYYNHDPTFDDEEQRAFWEWVKAYNRQYTFLDNEQHEQKIVRML